jgi:hypothetical protein
VVSDGEFIADGGGSAVDFLVPPSADVRDGVEDLLGGVLYKDLGGPAVAAHGYAHVARRAERARGGSHTRRCRHEFTGASPSSVGASLSLTTPLRNRNFRRNCFDAATAALGLTIAPHNLRDTAASLSIQAGASVIAVARLLGHEWAATTLNHYAGLFPTDLDDVAIRLDAAAREAVGDR